MVNFQNKNEEMSMEDILASIRKYVSEEDEAKKDNSTDYKKEKSFAEQENVIKLDQSHISDNAEQVIELPKIDAQDSKFYEEQSTLSEQVATTSQEKAQSPFGKLTDAIKSYGKSSPQNHINLQDTPTSQLTIDKFLSEIATQVIQKWVDNNLRNIVEEIVTKEIEKIKSE